MKTLKLKNYRRILIVRPDRLGDLILTLPVAQLLKSLCPELTIDYLASTYAAPILKYAKYVDSYLPYTDEAGQPLAMAKLIEQLSMGNYDLALFLKPNWRSAFAILLSNIKIRVGTSRRPYSFLFNVRENVRRKHSNMHETDLNIQMLKPFGIDKGSDPSCPSLVVESGLNEVAAKYGLADKYIVIHPGSKGSAPNWLLDNYLKLADRLSGQMPIVITGQGNIDSKLSGKTINLLNQTSLDELARIVARARLFISGGTGPMHLASALGTPVIALFPSNPYLGPVRWGPRCEKHANILPTEHSNHKCSINENGTCECMIRIDVGLVYKKALEMLS
jgi:heptosyltransferase-3